MQLRMTPAGTTNWIFGIIVFAIAMGNTEIPTETFKF